TSQSSTSTSTRTSSFVNTHTRNDAPVAMPLQPRISTGTQPSSEIIDITSTFSMAADTDDVITSGLADSVSKHNAMKATVKEWEKCDICEEVIEDSPSHMMRCKCRFHHLCIEEWTKNSKNCPTCGTVSISATVKRESYDDLFRHLVPQIFRCS
uniref:RING-type domain-containing protein n=1 Tax=Clytia hemisphaerica TaxID=252671 RepID=A0A7M5WRG4_9CNID